MFGLHPAARAAAAAVDGRQARRRPRDRAAGAEPLALRRDGGGRGRRPRLGRPQRLAEPADRHRRRAARRSRASTSAAASSRPRSTARSRRCRPATSTPCGSPATTSGTTTKGRRAVAAHAVGRRPARSLGAAMRSTFAAVDDFAPGAGDRRQRRELPATPTWAGARRGRPGDPRQRRRRGDHRRPGRLGHALRPRHRRRRLDGRQRRATSPASIAAFFGDLGDQAEQGHAGDDQRVRPPGRRERQPRASTTATATSCSSPAPGSRAGSTTAPGRGSPTTDDADLLVTTDYRSVLAEVVSTRFGASTAAVFPRFSARVRRRDDVALTRSALDKNTF